MTTRFFAFKIRFSAAFWSRTCLGLVFMAELFLVGSVAFLSLPARADTIWSTSTLGSSGVWNTSTLGSSTVWTSAASSSSSSSTTTVSDDGTPPCPDTDLAVGLRQAHSAWQSTQAAAGWEAYKTVLKGQAEHPMRNYKGDISKKYCLEGITKFFNAILGLLTDIDGIIQIIKSLIQSLLDQVCSAVASSINSLLSSICLPLPALSSLSFSIPSLSGTSCDGLSLSDVVKVNASSPLDVNEYAPPSGYFSNLLSRDLKDMTLFKW